MTVIIIQEPHSQNSDVMWLESQGIESWVKSSSAKRPAKRSAKTQLRSKTRLESELDLATEIWSKNILRPNSDLSQETC